MAATPESVLARQAGICYVILALVTKFSANLISRAGVSEHNVFELFAPRNPGKPGNAGSSVTPTGSVM
jgi:purine nucleoside phosphorylase